MNWLRKTLIVSALVATSSRTAHADPLNPLAFPSLGTQTIAAGSYTIDTGATPPTFGGFSGTVSELGVAVFRFDSLTVNAGAVITVTGGYGKRPVAILSSGNLTFAGSINANGNIGSNANGNNGGVGGPGGAGSGGNGGVGAAGVTGQPADICTVYCHLDPSDPFFQYSCSQCTPCANVSGLGGLGGGLGGGSFGLIGGAPGGSFGGLGGGSTVGVNG